jgi:hypothetical protein
MTNSRKPQSEKLATGGGRETTAVKPDNIYTCRSSHSSYCWRPAETKMAYKARALECHPDKV